MSCSCFTHSRIFSTPVTDLVTYETRKYPLMNVELEIIGSPDGPLRGKKRSPPCNSGATKRDSSPTSHKTA